AYFPILCGVSNADFDLHEGVDNNCLSYLNLHHVIEIRIIPMVHHPYDYYPYEKLMSSPCPVIQKPIHQTEFLVNRKKEIWRNERLAHKTPKEKVEMKRRSPLVRHFQQFESTARNRHSPADDR
ncbi:hypothetical protein HAX54_014816, partial [Datura stramonium]|nr:hypothetical protein [Datura stramonium]